MRAETADVHVAKSHIEAEQAIRVLLRSGIDVKQLSLVGRGYHTEEQPLGFYTSLDKIKAWGGMGAFWGGVWGFLFTPAIFFIPGLGLIALAGPLVASLVGALEGAVIVGGVSALGAALTRIGIPRDQVIKYETEIKADKYLLMVHGSSEEIARARSVLDSQSAWLGEEVGAAPVPVPLSTPPLQIPALV